MYGWKTALTWSKKIHIQFVEPLPICTTATDSPLQCIKSKLCCMDEMHGANLGWITYYIENCTVTRGNEHTLFLKILATSHRQNKGVLFYQKPSRHYLECLCFERRAFALWAKLVLGHQIFIVKLFVLLLRKIAIIQAASIHCWPVRLWGVSKEPWHGASTARIRSVLAMNIVSLLLMMAWLWSLILDYLYDLLHRPLLQWLADGDAFQF